MDSEINTNLTDLRNDIPDIVIGRLPIYLRTLKLLESELKQHSQDDDQSSRDEDKERENVSSEQLGKRLGISSAQIRKDLSHFGEFGKQGTGYKISVLCKQLERILKVDCIWPVVLVGAGYLGHALANYNGFENRGFRIVAVFDSDPEKIGVELGGVVVEPSSAIGASVERHKCQIAIIAVRAEAAQDVANTLIQAGIKSILCYAPITLNVPDEIRVEYIDPVIQLQHMTFYLEKGSIDE
jgi:redox-sensing transcriptional repressor